MTRAIGTPAPGFFRMRQVTGGVWVAALIYRPCPIEFEPETFQAVDRHYHLEAEINSKPADFNRVWTSGRRVDMAKYLFLKDDRAWAREYAPHLPEAMPHKPVNVGAIEPIF